MIKLTSDKLKSIQKLDNGNYSIIYETGFNRYESNGIISSCISIGSKIIENKDASSSLNKLIKKHGITYEHALAKIVFTVWDSITVDEYIAKKSSVPYIERFERVKDLFDTFDCKNVEIIRSITVSTFNEASSHFHEALANDEEGTILKSLSAGWKDGKPKWQCKMKKVDFYDLKITGFNYGKKGTKNEHVISSVDVETEYGILKTSPGGISETEMIYITDHQEELLGTIIEVKCSGLSQNSDGEYSLLHPVYNKRRDDKTVANTIEECIAIDAMIDSI